MRRVLTLAISLTLVAAAAENSFLIRNATIYPVSGPRIDAGAVLVVDGKIAEVGAKVAPRGKIRIIEGKGLSVYPGMIDSGTAVGITEIGSVRESGDQGELGEFNPQLRALIAVNPSSEHIPVTRANGITSVLVLPAPEGGRGSAIPEIIQGQASLMHLSGWTWEEMEIRRDGAVQVLWPTVDTRGHDGPGGRGRPIPYAEAKRNQEVLKQKLSDFLEQARRYQFAKQAGQPDLKKDLKLEAMLPVLEGKVPLMVYAAREREIRDAVQWAEAEKLQIVLAGVRRPGAMTVEIAKKKIPVILGSTLETPIDDDSPYDEPFTLPSELLKAGVKFAFASFGSQFARNLPYEAAQAVAFGLPYDEGLRSVTLNAAEIWGVGAQLGSIEPGKVADLIVTDGDPLEVRTQVKLMFIKGEAVDLESKHTKLYKKYLERP
jgi:imidazolonepropionase-like amidohydrolase